MGLCVVWEDGIHKAQVNCDICKRRILPIEIDSPDWQKLGMVKFPMFANEAAAVVFTHKGKCDRIHEASLGEDRFSWGWSDLDVWLVYTMNSLGLHGGKKLRDAKARAAILARI